ncbi:hypothetical protein C8F04DRAFT_1186727 [Mycena alexandri]|uniref:Uncharacterized protein n=1 Tax=Mycena alexandri TaxID=1745969 RepID=A0AAD6SNL0_9AGAR|nr:hypothetical protein C8F04DRAFT_1186727 [Mycena alexandri]
MFENGNNFIRNGDTFIENPRKDHLTIHAEDLNLLEHIATQNIVREVVSARRRSTGRVKRVRVNAGTKQIYRASVFSSSMIFTAVVYEGQASAQSMSEDLNLNHYRLPRRLVHCVILRKVFHACSAADMIPANVALAQCRRLSRLHEAYLMQQMGAAQYWWRSNTGNNLFRFNSQPYIVMIRASTGRLCIDILHQSDSDSSGLTWNRPIPTGTKPLPSRTLLHSIPLRELLGLLVLEDAPVPVITIALSRVHWHHIATECGTVHLGPISLISNLTNPYVSMHEMLLTGVFSSVPAIEKYTSDGWARVRLPSDYAGVKHFRIRYFLNSNDRQCVLNWWLSQKSRLLGTKKYCADQILFTVSTWYPMRSCALSGTFMANAPADDIYLFLFQPEVVVWEGRLSIQRNHAANRKGRKAIGVPEVLLDTRITGASWTQQNHEIMDEIHIAQEFNPGTTELADALGYPLAVVTVIGFLSLILRQFTRLL